ncbi:DEAD/DEAH box helicase [[Mycoplasma] mobile]|uniref:Swf/snf family helicase-like protein n=1 Tax=Mycoplasma mobile (strain ATCC 43663 / 163K / NCTC 11711) TaxID=267748 RepID=Q6KHX7_MYCM1|nr:DEAD/DEAH box helicase [[Mycoplasma] mobile]AAT27799.1 swf/snf family helicase-like protein [Mycoplasma mobile 163K]
MKKEKSSPDLNKMENYFLKINSHKTDNKLISISIFIEENNHFTSLFFKNEFSNIFYFIPGKIGVFKIEAKSKLNNIVNFLTEITVFNNSSILSFDMKLSNLNLLVEFSIKNELHFLYGNKEIEKININNSLPDMKWLQFKVYDSKRFLLESFLSVSNIEIISESNEFILFNITLKSKENIESNNIYFKNIKDAKEMIQLFKNLTKVSFTKSEIRNILEKYENLYNNLKNVKLDNFDLNTNFLKQFKEKSSCTKRLELYYDVTLQKIIVKVATKHLNEYKYLNESSLIKNDLDLNKNLEDKCDESEFLNSVLSFLDSFDNIKKQGYINSKEKYFKLKALIKRWKSLDDYEIYIDESFETKDNQSKFSINSLELKNNLLEMSLSLPLLSNEEVVEAIRSYLNKDEFFETKDNRLINLKNIDFENLEEDFKKINLNIYSLLSKNENNFYLNFHNSYYLLDFIENSNQPNSIDLAKKLKNIIKNAETEVKKLKINDDLKTKLHDYQFEGVKWFKKMIALNMGGILADEMGLGKTIQTIALLDNLYNYENIKKPSIVICPSSLIYNWKNEFKKFSEKLKIVVIDGKKNLRTKLINDNRDNNIIFITSYHQFARDSKEFENVEFYCSFADEGQMIKNYLTKFTKEIKKINSKYRFALSGTPLENNLLELWSIFDFILPNYLLSKNAYKRVFYKPFLEGNTKHLLAKINPFILRRLKSEVLDSLSDKEIKVIKIKQKSDEKTFYQKELSKIKYSLDILKNNSSLTTNNKHLIVLKAINHLKIIASSPFVKSDKFDTSEKLNYCINLIKSIKLLKQKVLIFTQFTKNIPFFEKNFIKSNIKYDIISGKTNKKERFKITEYFNESSDIDVLIISLRAGSLGLNLTSANNVILYDIWWNQSVESQAIDRVHRIGQKRGVNVFKLIMKDTIEEKVFELQSQKQKIIDIVLENSLETKNIDLDFLFNLLE